MVSMAARSLARRALAREGKRVSTARGSDRITLSLPAVYRRGATDDLTGPFTQGVALGWNLHTPSALVSQLYEYSFNVRLKMEKAGNARL
jgi:hypothetical protein